MVEQLLSLTDGAIWVKAVTIAVILIAAYVLTMWVALIIWTYRDAQARIVDRNTQIGAGLLVALFNVPGLLLYLAIRPPELLAETYNRQLEAEAFLHELQEQSGCPVCSRPIEASFLACPYCRTQLQAPCGACGRELRSGWTMCPYCGTDREPEQRRQGVAASSGRGGYTGAPYVRPRVVTSPQPTASR
jgi:hypothetical protein